MGKLSIVALRLSASAVRDDMINSAVFEQMDFIRA
jgi:hypothetical protein